MIYTHVNPGADNVNSPLDSLLNSWGIIWREKGEPIELSTSIMEVRDFTKVNAECLRLRHSASIKPSVILG